MNRRLKTGWCNIYGLLDALSQFVIAVVCAGRVLKYERVFVALDIRLTAQKSELDNNYDAGDPVWVKCSFH
jgi:hypothetical protein